MRAISILAACAAVLVSGAVHAADKAGAPAAPGPSPIAVDDLYKSPWNSCHVEGGVDNRVVVNRDSLGAGTVQGLGLVVGAGCDRVISSRLVAGVFGRYGFTTADSNLSGLHVRFDRPWLLAGRGGYLITDQTLIYGVVGYQHGMLKASDGTGTASFKAKGLTLGGGIEIMLGKSMSLGLDYLYGDLERDSALGVKPDAHAVTLGFRHKF